MDSTTRLGLTHSCGDAKLVQLGTAFAFHVAGRDKRNPLPDNVVFEFTAIGGKVDVYLVTFEFERDNGRQVGWSAVVTDGKNIKITIRNHDLTNRPISPEYSPVSIGADGTDKYLLGFVVQAIDLGALVYCGIYKVGGQ